MAGHSSITIPLCSAPESHTSVASNCTKPSFRPICVVMACEASRNGNGCPLKTIGVIQLEDIKPRKSPPPNVGFYFGTKSNRVKIYYALKSHGKAKFKLQAKTRQINHLFTSSSGVCPHQTSFVFDCRFHDFPMATLVGTDTPNDSGGLQTTNGLVDTIPSDA